MNKFIKIVYSSILFSVSMLHAGSCACPYDNFDILTSVWEGKTTDMLDDKEDAIKEALKDYKEALKKKKKEMISLLRVLTKIEALARENQAKRKAILHNVGGVFSADTLLVNQ